MRIIPILIVAVSVVFIALNLIIRKKGYSVPGKTVVRCSKGHIFKTVWIEGGSLKAVRLGPLTRYQYCPVGKHWAIIHPVKDGDLTSKDKQTLAKQNS